MSEYLNHLVIIAASCFNIFINQTEFLKTILDCFYTMDTKIFDKDENKLWHNYKKFFIVTGI